MSQSCGRQALKRTGSTRWGRRTPDNTPLAFIYAQQKQTLTKKQMQSVADALLSEATCINEKMNPFHALRYEHDGFVVDASALEASPKNGPEVELAALQTCLKLANVCRNKRGLTLYINKMAHDMDVVRQSRESSVESISAGSSSSVDLEHFVEDGERGTRCLTV